MLPLDWIEVDKGYPGARNSQEWGCSFLFMSENQPGALHNLSENCISSIPPLVDEIVSKTDTGLNTKRLVLSQIFLVHVSKFYTELCLRAKPRDGRIQLRVLLRDGFVDTRPICAARWLTLTLTCFTSRSGSHLPMDKNQIQDTKPLAAHLENHELKSSEQQPVPRGVSSSAAGQLKCLLAGGSSNDSKL